VLSINPIILSNVFLQSPRCELSFLFREPRRSAWEVRQHEKGDESDEDRDDTLDDEQPLPGTQTTRPVQIAGDTGGD
jgi:hypothetical protein